VADKELTGLLLDTLEELYLEKLTLLSIFITNQHRLPEWMADWKQYFEWMKQQPEVRERARVHIAALRQRMEQGQNLTAALEALLKIAPTGSDVH
jgi:hypothetical protein